MELEYRGNLRAFQDFLLSKAQEELQAGKGNRWQKLIDVYIRQLTIIKENPYPEDNSNPDDDSLPPSIKVITQNTKYPNLFYRWALRREGLGNYRIIYCVHNYYKVVLLHVFEKRYNGAIREEDLAPAEEEYDLFCLEEPNLYEEARKYGKLPE